MKLYYSSTSPFARNVLLVANYHGLDIEVVKIDPINQHAALMENNPLGKVPALVLDKGEALYDSAVISEYLDGLGREESLYRRTNEAYWRVRKESALVNGLLDAAVSMRIETMRDDAEQSTFWMKRWESKVEAGVAAMAKAWQSFDEKTTLSHLTFPVALDYLSFRTPEIDWRSVSPEMTQWAEKKLSEEIYRQTDPRN